MVERRTLLILGAIAAAIAIAGQFGLFSTFSAGFYAKMDCNLDGSTLVLDDDTPPFGNLCNNQKDAEVAQIILNNPDSVGEPRTTSDGTRYFIPPWMVDEFKGKLQEDPRDEAIREVGILFSSIRRVADADDDNDGVKDERDACPQQAGTKANGCPVQDADGDGVADGKDACIRTAGSTVNGCPTVLQQIQRFVQQVINTVTGVFMQ